MLALLFLLLALWRRRWVSVTALVLAVVLTATPVAVSVTQMAPRAEADEPGTRLRVMTFNLAWSNGQLDALEAEILAVDADLLFLTEVADRHQPLIDRLAAHYPERHTGLTDELFGRLPLGEMQRIRTQKYASLWLVQSSFAGRPLTIAAGHPYPPIGDDWDRVNALWFSQAQAALTGLDGPTLVLGDLNATPWCRRLRELLHYSGLRRAGGWFATWPTNVPAWAGIAIDHVLVSEEFSVLDRYTTSGAGSDHRGLVVDLLLLP